MRLPLLKGLIALCAIVMLCGTPLASARAQALPGDFSVEATGPGGASVAYNNAGFICAPPPGSTFPLGPTTVNCNDGAVPPNPTGSFTVTVVDTTGPAFSGVPSSISTPATSPTGAVVNYTDPTATDLVDGSRSVSCSPASGSTFPAGTTTGVNCSASDTRGNPSSASFSVTVGPWDSTPPNIGLPADFTAEATSSAGAAVSFSVSFTDPDDPVSASGCDAISGSTFSLGQHTITCNATDSHGNSSQASFKITVVDTTGPIIGSVPGSITVEATSTSGAVHTYTSPTANDAVTGSRLVGCLPSSGSTFSIGTTAVVCTASDGNGNSSTASFNVTVQDTVPPVITNVPSDISVDATSPGGAVVGYSNPNATDLGASIPVNCSPASGSLFPVGTTTVTCTANDGHGNTSSAQFHISIAPFDATPPVIGVPADITVEAVSGSGASVSYSVSFTDPDDAVLTSGCSPVSGSTFGLGQTTVNCSATDQHSNTANKSFKVTVRDTTAPTVSAPPADITKEATAPGGVAVTFTKPTATDTVDGTVPVTCTPGSGSTFALGVTNVDCKATDAHGNSASRSFKVTIQDTLPPIFGSAPDVRANAASGGNTTVTYAKPGATDAVDGAVPVTCTPASGSTFPIGSTTVRCSASDTSGHSATKTFSVIVTDNTPPAITVPADITAEATAASGAAVTYSFSANDPDDAVSTSTCTPSSGSVFALATTTVTCTATDSHSNTATKTFKVTIVDTTPPSLSKVPADITAEANGLAGSNVNYTKPTAVDLVDGPIADVACGPASGTRFAIANTTVNCSATDAHGNSRSTSFHVIVRDSTPPTLLVPAAYTLNATTPTGIPDTVGGIVYFKAAASATDIVDPHPVVTNNVPSFILVGTWSFGFTARDASGNAVSKNVTLTVLPQPPAGTPQPPLPPTVKPPADVANLKVTPHDGSVRLVWSAVAGAARYIVFRSESGKRTTSAAGHGQAVYTGSATSFTDRGLTNGTEYRYVVVSEDAAGNQSAGVASVAVPRRDLLLSPKDGARLRKAPRLVWAANAEADYFNAQLLLNGNKILSVWPVKPSFLLKKSWKYLGHKYTLKPGLYTWYVWPGFGARAAVKYGELVGSRSFRIVR